MVFLGVNKIYKKKQSIANAQLVAITVREFGAANIVRSEWFFIIVNLEYWLK